MTLYAVKPAFQRALDPAVRLAIRARVSADQLTLAAVAVSLVGGVLLALSAREPRLMLVAVPVVGARLGLNAMDGLLARRTRTATPAGELLNEVGDRLADLCLVGGLVLAGHADPRLGAIALGVIALPATVGVAARAAGGDRRYEGPLSKPDRMVALALAVLLAQVLPVRAVINGYLALLCVGAPLTSAVRYRRALAQLSERSEVRRG